MNIGNIKKQSIFITEERDDTMAANAGAIVNQSMFDSFLKTNMDKINAIVPKNPTISKDDVYEEESN